MEALSTLKYSSDGLVSFDAEKHVYYKGETRLQGVTSWIAQYKNTFDSERISKAYALKHGLKQEDVLKKWKDESDLSKIAGTSCHDVFENFHKTGLIISKGIYPKEKSAVKFIEDMFINDSRLIPIDAEVIVYNDTIASMIDMVCRNDKHEYFIFDWKTNKKIVKDAFNNAKMKYPFDRFPDANYFHYSMQVAIYKHLYKVYPIKECFIVHLTDDGYEIIRPIPMDISGFINGN